MLKHIRSHSGRTSIFETPKNANKPLKTSDLFNLLAEREENEHFRTPLYISLLENLFL